jgi:hypothetical protein
VSTAMCRLRPLTFLPLCRTRHNGNHAGRVVMPGSLRLVGVLAAQLG